MKIGVGKNEYGVSVSVHECRDCGNGFTVCPPAVDEWGGCQATACISYDPKRDAEIIMGYKDSVRMDN